MEREKAFLPTLGKVASLSDGRLKAMHADFFSMHYHGTSVIKPPIVRTPQVFEGIEPVPWEAGTPIFYFSYIFCTLFMNDTLVKLCGTEIRFTF